MNKSRDDFYNITNKICNDIINYFKNERDIEYKLNNNLTPKQIYQGFLVDKNWVDKWKRYSYYDYIKNNFLNKNINDERPIKKYIIDKQNNKFLNYNEINDIENYIVKDVNQLKLLEKQNRTFVLLNTNFLKQFPIKSNLTLTTFYISYQNIQILSQNVPIFSFKTNNNTIINDGNNNQEKSIYNSEFLKHLLRFAYLKGEIFSKSNRFKNNLNQAYIINSALMNKLKELYNLKDIITYLNNYQILAGINYQNCDNNFPKISKFLNENQINYINTSSGIKFIFQPSDLKKDINGNYYPSYRLSYSLIPKNSAAINKLNEYAAKEVDGIYNIQNTAEWGGLTATANAEYIYNGFSKQLEDDNNGEDDYYTFTLNINPSGKYMNNKNELEIHDIYENMSVDFSSININPSEGVSYYSRGNELIITIPDGQPTTITYRARALFDEGASEGDSVRISNTAYIKDLGYLLETEEEK